MIKELVKRNWPLMLAVLFFFAVVLHSCRSTKEEVKTVEFDAMDPPIPKNVFLEQSEKPDGNGNVDILLTAEFAENDAAKLRQANAFEIDLGEKDSKILLDNGEEGDVKANDKVFSTVVKVKIEELANLAKAQSEFLQRTKNQVVEFDGRIRRIRRATSFDLESFRGGKRVPIDFFPLTLITSENLTAIRTKSLMITDLSVVKDPGRTFDPCSAVPGNPNGVWSFKALITNMANNAVTGMDPLNFTVEWVDKILFGATTHPVSGDATVNRVDSKTQFIRAWLKNSGIAPGAGLPPTWKTLGLKLEAFPVRLLAIVNRLDLRGNMGYSVGNAGEGRLVFGFSDSNAGCNTGNGGPETMTIIFEYGIPITKCQALHDFGKQWWDLKDEPFGASYNTKLEAITNVFTAANAKPSRPNGSALNHLRTNEFLTSPWDIRDFEIDKDSHFLKIIHPSREPMVTSNGPGGANVAALVTFANGLSFGADLSASYDIPGSLAGMHAPMPTPTRVWRGSAASVMTPLNRKGLGLNACSGCHTSETKTIFAHVKPQNGGAALLSGFMTGIGADDSPDADVDPLGDFVVNDPGPAPNTGSTPFNDAKFRADKLEQLVFSSPCLVRPGFPRELIGIRSVLQFRPLNMVH